MGFIDAIDGALATAKGRRQDRRELEQFIRRMSPGRTYYTAHEVQHPWGRSTLLAEWTFPKKHLGLPATAGFGKWSVAQVWAECGPILERRPHGLQTYAEFAEDGSDCELIGDTKKKRKAIEKELAKLRRSIAGHGF